MKNYIVTIARQYGSGGREVGQHLAQISGYKFYDKDLIILAAQKSGYSTDALKNVDEKAANSLLYTLALGSAAFNHGIEQVNLPINDKLFVIQSEICCVGPPKMNGSWWRVQTKCGPLEKKMANHFSILALRTP